jgi:hypothetical protein
MKRERITTQIRLPLDIHNYAQNEARRLGISANAALLTLIDEGRRFREAIVKCEITVKEKEGATP